MRSVDRISGPTQKPAPPPARDDRPRPAGGLPCELGLVLDELLKRPSVPGEDEIVELARLLGDACDRFEALARELGEMRTAAAKLMESRISAGSPRPSPERLASADSGKRMSIREREVIAGLLGGKSNREISTTLGISEKTVKNHLWKAYRKIGVRSRTQLFHHILYPC